MSNALLKSEIFMWLNCNLGKVNLELMLPAVSPMLHMSCGALFGVCREALHSSDRHGSVPFFFAILCLTVG